MKAKLLWGMTFIIVVLGILLFFQWNSKPESNRSQVLSAEKSTLEMETAKKDNVEASRLCADLRGQLRSKFDEVIVRQNELVIHVSLRAIPDSRASAIPHLKTVKRVEDCFYEVVNQFDSKWSITPPSMVLDSSYNFLIRKAVGDTNKTKGSGAGQEPKTKLTR